MAQNPADASLVPAIPICPVINSYYFISGRLKEPKAIETI
jgi:hypothetical protein